MDEGGYVAVRTLQREDHDTIVGQPAVQLTGGADGGEGAAAALYLGRQAVLAAGLPRAQASEAVLSAEARQALDALAALPVARRETPASRELAARVANRLEP